MPKTFLIGLAACFYAIFSTSVSAQTSVKPLLFGCTLNAGANAVAVHLDNDEITYSYADANDAIELSLREKIEDVDFITSLWEDPNFYEAVTFYNGETSYEVFGIPKENRARGSREILNGEPVDGGIVVRAPNDAPMELTCDENSVEPIQAFMRFARLNQLKDPNYDLYESCIASGIRVDACAEPAIEQCLEISAELPHETQCVSEHLTRALVALEKSFEDAILSAQNTGRDVEALVRSQTAFIESRSADCEIEVTLSYYGFDENEALQKCIFDYTNQRNKFLFFYSHFYP